MPVLVRFRFRLYVADGGLNSVLAISNLEALCREYLPGRHRIEVVDVLKEPRRALADGILLTPALVKISPAPEARVIGNLSNTRTVLDALGINRATP